MDVAIIKDMYGIAFDYIRRSVATVFFVLCLGCWPSFAAKPPYYDIIMKIMSPLEYSGVPVMVKPEVLLTLDFHQRTWTLHNIHTYDHQGAIILEQGRYGLCAELATFVFERIRHLLGSRYEVSFAMVAQADFFAANASNHIVLLLVDRADKQVYMIDPSFKKYALMRDLPEYQLVNVQSTLSFVQDKSADVFFSVNQSIPLYIKGDFLLSFAVTSVDGKFDKNNFIFAISVHRRRQFVGRDIVVIGRHDHVFEDFEDKSLLNELLTTDEINVLFDKLKVWIGRI